MNVKLTVACLSLALAAGAVLGGAPARAYTVIGTESATAGFIGEIFASVGFTGYVAASDGELPFQPFGATFDVSDGIDLSGNGFPWSQAADSQWTQLGGNQTWVLPANLTGFGCGSENEPICEPVGHFISPNTWVTQAIGTWAILDDNGNISDSIQTFNTAAGAELLFRSDPSLPEPASLVLLGTALAGLGLIRRRRKAV